jgi:hypothetical protein
MQYMESQMGLTELIIAGAIGAAITAGATLMWRLIADARQQAEIAAAFVELDAEVMADIERHPFALAEADRLHAAWRAGHAKAEAVMAARNVQLCIEHRLIAAGFEHTDAAEGDAA